MTQYEKEYRYVEGVIKKAKSIQDITGAKLLLRQFIDTWIVQIPPTDKTFNKDRNTLSQMAEQKFQEISKGNLIR
jgi:hypothetical protein